MRWILCGMCIGAWGRMSRFEQIPIKQNKSNETGGDSPPLAGGVRGGVGWTGIKLRRFALDVTNPAPNPSRKGRGIPEALRLDRFRLIGICFWGYTTSINLGAYVHNKKHLTRLSG